MSDYKPRLKGVVPLPPARVWDVPYIVQEGDTMERITARFVRPDAWPGLVGANAHHKPLKDEEGQHYAVFQELRTGEPLLIPATWTPRSTGVLGAPFDKSGTSKIDPSAISLDPATAIIKLIVNSWSVVLKAIQTMFPQPSPNPQWQPPVNPTTKEPYTPQDIATVVAGWIPYFQKMPAGLPPGVTIPAQLPANPLDWPGQTTNGMPNLLVVAAKQAAELLGATQVASGDVLGRVPWDVVPWTEFPWIVVNKDGCWALYQGALQGTAARPMGQKYFTPGSPFSGAPLFANYTPALLTEKWDQTPWTSVPWGQINWPSVEPGIFTDPTVQKCMTDPGAVARIQQMLAYKSCFDGQGAAKFAKYLCPRLDGTYEDLTKCAETLPQLPCGPNQVLINGVCISPTGQLPPWFESVDWNCQPFPDCLIPQIPAGQQPCQPWPTCFSDYLAGLGIAPATKEPKPAAKKGLSTGAKVAIGVAVGGLTLGLGTMLLRSGKD